VNTGVANSDNAPLAPGLYLVATPIGNLEDITLRALRVLRSADLVACEDTRHTSKLLSHYGISTATISYHEHNERERAAELGQRLQRGERIALVTDAGTPSVSDPGYRLVQRAIELGVPVVAVPGPSALIAALVSSGLPTDGFRFAGFLPAKSGARRALLQQLAAEAQTVVFYEAPHRIVESLADVVATLGPDRRIVVARELTKLHEEVLRGPAAEVLAELKRRESVKGEITLLIARAEGGAARPAHEPLRRQLANLMRDEQLDEKSALKRLAKTTGRSKSDLYRELQRETGNL
jgi:16S rRNA (cytidine1402-2'-O)-methyltransferase